MILKIFKNLNFNFKNCEIKEIFDNMWDALILVNMLLRPYFKEKDKKIKGFETNKSPKNYYEFDQLEINTSWKIILRHFMLLNS